jgi:hypothetical protein
MNNASLVLAGLLVLSACATGTPAVRASDRAAALSKSAHLAQQTHQLLDQADAAIQASKAADAQAALDAAKANLDNPDLTVTGKRDEYASRAALLTRKLSELRAAQPAEPAKPAAPSLDKAEADLVEARKHLHGHELSAADVVSAQAAREKFQQSLEANQASDEKRDEHQQALSDADAEIRLAGLIADYVAGPGAAVKKGHELEQSAQVREARAAFASCAESTQKMLASEPVLGRTAIILADQRTSPKQVGSFCAAEAKKLGKKLARR